MPAPLAIVTEKFGSKDKLVDKIVDLVAKDSDTPKDELRKRLLPVANSKLLKIHTAANTLKEKFGSRDKLITATASALGKSKDKDFVASLDDLSSAKLVDMEKAAARRAKSAKPAAKK